MRRRSIVLKQWCEMQDALPIKGLPKKINIYTNHGLMLLPGGQISMILLEDEEIAFAEKCMRQRRLMGLAQCIESDAEMIQFKTGCLGKILNFNEVEEGLLLIVSGICRFDIVGHMNPLKPFHRVEVDYTTYAGDLTSKLEDRTVDRERLIRALDNYIQQFEVNADWEDILHTPDDKLVTALAMSGPFSAVEKQALLESPTLPEQCCIITTLMEMALLDTNQTYQ